MTDTKSALRGVPDWVPTEVQNYVFHTEMGQPIRSLARSQSCHASTIMRQIRKVESRRDDPLVDRAIKDLALEEEDAGPNPLEMMQALRRLAMPDALLAIALGMEQAVILQDNTSGEPDHGSKLPAKTAQSLALRGWIAESSNGLGKVLRYRITAAGRAALRDLVAQSENQARAFAEAPETFEHAPNGVGTWETRVQMSRPPTQETPVVALARRKSRDGEPFLSRAMVRAAERLREDYELAQVNAHRAGTPTPNWERVLKDITAHKPINTECEPAASSVRSALEYLGPGLSEVALRCCCLLEGLEITEKTMGWAARSGKVVLRIALQRLVLFYESNGELGPRIS